MGFTELSHAFIAAKYYVYLKEIFGDRGEAAFLHATRYYGEQRGRRMAQRAIRDGKPLTYETYCQYGEWVNTEEVKAQGLGNQSETTSLSPDFQIHIHVCPWHTQFKKAVFSRKVKKVKVFSIVRTWMRPFPEASTRRFAMRSPRHSMTMIIVYRRSGTPV